MLSSSPTLSQTHRSVTCVSLARTVFAPLAPTPLLLKSAALSHVRPLPEGTAAPRAAAGPPVPKAPLPSRLETVNGAMYLRKMELETKLQLLKVTW